MRIRDRVAITHKDSVWEGDSMGRNEPDIIRVVYGIFELIEIRKHH